MKIPYRYDVTQVVQHDRINKYSLDRVCVTRLWGRDHVVASNGIAIAYVPVELEDGDKHGTYVADAFDAAREAVAEECDELADFAVNPWHGTAHIHVADGVARVGDTTFGCRREESKYPNVDIPIEGDPIAVIRLDAQKLLELAKAIGASQSEFAVGVLIEVRGERAPLLVRPLNNLCNAHGLLMPIAKDGDEPIPALKSGGA